MRRGDASQGRGAAPESPDRPLLAGNRAAVLIMGLVGAAVVTVVGIAAGSGSPIKTSPVPIPGGSVGLPSADPRGRYTSPPAYTGRSYTTLDIIFGIFLLVCVLAVVITVIVLGVRLFLGRGSGLIRRRILEPEEMEMLLTPLATGVEMPRSSPVEQAIAQSRADIVSGTDVRAAVIAAWLRLEETAVSLGTAHRDADTPTDLVGRLLDEQHVGAQSLERLAGLYRRARYSPSELAERERTEALRALDDIRSELGGAAPSRPTAGPLVPPRSGSADSGRWV